MASSEAPDTAGRGSLALAPDAKASRLQGEHRTIQRHPFLQRLPFQIAQALCRHLDASDLAALRLVARSWRDTVSACVESITVTLPPGHACCSRELPRSLALGGGDATGSDTDSDNCPRQVDGDDNDDSDDASDGRYSCASRWYIFRRTLTGPLVLDPALLSLAFPAVKRATLRLPPNVSRTTLAAHLGALAAPPLALQELQVVETEAHSDYVRLLPCPAFCLLAPTLTRLKISWRSLPCDEGLLHLTNLSKLTALELHSGLPASQEGLVNTTLLIPLVRMTTLKRLSLTLSQWQIRNGLLMWLGVLSRLTALELEGPMPGKAIHSTRLLPDLASSLVELHLRGLTFQTPADRAPLGVLQLTALRELQLETTTTAFPDQVVAEVARASWLTSLRLSGPPGRVTPTAIDPDTNSTVVARLPLPRLELLALRNVCLPWPSVHSLSVHLRTLHIHQVDLQGADPLTGEGLANLASRLPRLQSLHVAGRMAVDLSASAALAALTHLTELQLSAAAAGQACVDVYDLPPSLCSLTLRKATLAARGRGGVAGGCGAHAAAGGSPATTAAGASVGGLLPKLHTLHLEQCQVTTDWAAKVTTPAVIAALSASTPSSGCGPPASSGRSSRNKQQQQQQQQHGSQRKQQPRQLRRQRQRHGAADDDDDDDDEEEDGRAALVCPAELQLVGPLITLLGTARLRSLAVVNSNLRDPDLLQLSRSCCQLTCLVLKEDDMFHEQAAGAPTNALTNAGLEAVASLTSLRELGVSVRHACINERSVRALCALTNLQHLSLGLNWHAAAAGVKGLTTLRGLRALHLFPYDGYIAKSHTSAPNISYLQLEMASGCEVKWHGDRDDYL